MLRVRGQAIVLSVGWRPGQVTMENPCHWIWKSLSPLFKVTSGVKHKVCALDDMKTKKSGADSGTLRCLTCLHLSHESVLGVPV